MIKQVSIIGLGLIGGSMGLALKRNNPHLKIVGVDPNRENLNIAIERQAIDKGTDNLREGILGAEIVFLATPINTMYEVARIIAPYLEKGTIITDVGSCKVEVTEVLETIFKPNCCFIGGHPMAGSEQTGMFHADPYLFENAVYVLTPTNNINFQVVDKLSKLIQTTGAKVITMTPSRHDLIVAAVSHLPHLLAVNLVNSIEEYAERDDLTLFLAAGGFRDTTRIAMGNEIIWSDIFLSNKPMVLEVLNSFKQTLTYFESLLLKEKRNDIKDFILKARQLRQRIPSKAKGILPKVYELTLKVPDEPGIIAKIANVLSEKNINITDIEILHIREGDDGAVRIGLKKEEDLNSAYQLLKENNFKVKRR
jgi:prephenate dehydrogenase